MLTTLLHERAEVVGVVSDEDRGLNSDYADLVPICEKYSVPILLTRDINSSETLEWIKGYSPDIIFCMGWSRLLKKELLYLLPMGVIGYHPAELPMNRGRHPLVWALVLGMKSTASTFFFMNEGADSGDILSQRPIKISDEDDASTLYVKMVNVAKSQIVEILPALSSGNFRRIAQDESKANVWRKRGTKDGEIDWRMSAQSIHNLVRGLTYPYVGAHFMKNERRYTVWKTKIVESLELENIEPGKVIDYSSHGNAIVKCADGCIELVDIEPPIDISKCDYL
ncbi:MAG: formyl transferase [Nitrospirales bacterium]|nr:MAG: formyl transferase [Nitrospirales bacterium]